MTSLLGESSGVRGNSGQIFILSAKPNMVVSNNGFITLLLSISARLSFIMISQGMGRNHADGHGVRVNMQLKQSMMLSQYN
jgi:hypothetical protein